MNDRDHPPAWLAEAQTAPEAIPPDADRPAPLLFDAEHRPITSPEQWETRRAELFEAWRSFLGVIPRPRNVPAMRVIEQERVEPEAEGQGAVDRLLITFEIEPGRSVEAYVLRPSDPAPERGRPGAVVLHATTDITIRQPGGLEGPADKHIGLHLARRGYVAICPPCFLWDGPAEPDRYNKAVARQRARHPGATGTAEMLFDAQRTLDLLVAQEDVDASRIGSIGHSLGAKEVLFLSAFDPRVKATVSSEGGIGIGYSNWDAPWYHGEEVREPGFSLDHAQVLALVAPRAFLLIGGDSADGDLSWPYIDACLPVWNLLGNPEGVGMLNHREGHAYPLVAQERAYEWLDWVLGEGEGASC